MTLFLRVLVVYLATMVFSGVLNALQTRLSVLRSSVVVGLLLVFTEESGAVFPMGVLAALWTVAAVVVHMLLRAVPVPTKVLQATT